MQSISFPADPEVEADKRERANRAVAAFRQMQHSLTSYARALSGNSKIRVQISNGPPRTDGNIIYYRPPIGLGDKTPHDRNLCGKRDEDGLRSCSACRIREEVLVNIYHEIAHVAFGTFEGDSRNMSEARKISEFLPYLFNCVEDARVDSAMFTARKGMRKMFQADVFKYLRAGVPDANGEIHVFAEAPLNVQISLGAYFDSATGYEGWKQYAHPDVVRDIEDERVQEILGLVRYAETAGHIFQLCRPLHDRLQELGYFQPKETSDDDEGDCGGDDEQGSGADESGADAGDDAEEESDGDGPDQDQAGDSTPSEAPGSPASEASGGGDQARESDAGDESGPEGPEGSDDRESDAEEPRDESDSRSDSADTRDGEGEAGAQDSGEQSDEVSSDPEDGTDGEKGVEDGADSDRLPEEVEGSGERDGQDPAPEPGAEPEDGGPADGFGGTSDGEPHGDTESRTDGGGDEDEGQPLGEGVPESGAGESESRQLDDGQGGGKGREGSPAGASDSSESGSDHPDAGDEDRDERSGEGSGAQGNQPELSLPQGSAEDVNAAFLYAHPDLTSEKSEELNGTEDEKSLVDVVVIQGKYFETPSIGVDQVFEHDYAPNAPGWNVSSTRARRNAELLGIQCDMDIPESILGPALLKTRRIFSDNETTGLQVNLRSGRVNARALGRRAWKKDDDRLFSKKRVPAKRDYAVLIMADISSSNLGPNLARLKRSIKAQAELCNRVGIDFAIVGHSASAEVVEDDITYAMHLHHVKKWNEPWTGAIQERVATLTVNGGNLDGHAMEFGRKYLASQNATDKVLMYYTDGKMPASNHDEELEVLERQIKLCKRDRITLMGVGMGTDSPVRHGLDTVQVDSDDDLSAVIEHLGKRLTKMGR